MNYQAVYDFSEEQMPLVWFAPLLFLLIGIGMLIYYIRNSKKNLQPELKILFLGALFTVIGGYSSYAMLHTNLGNFNELKSKYEKREFKIVEGVVSDFKQSSTRGKSRDQFRVDSVTFKYANYSPGNGFCKTASDNGPINRNGLQVRVSYTENGGELFILKLEIAR